MLQKEIIAYKKKPFYPSRAIKKFVPMVTGKTKGMESETTNLLFVTIWVKYGK